MILVVSFPLSLACCALLVNLIVSCFFEPGRIGGGTPCKGETTRKRDESSIVTRPALLDSNDDEQQSAGPRSEGTDTDLLLQLLSHPDLLPVRQYS